MQPSYLLPVWCDTCVQSQAKEVPHPGIWKSLQASSKGRWSVMIDDSAIIQMWQHKWLHKPLPQCLGCARLDESRTKEWFIKLLVTWLIWGSQKSVLSSITPRLRISSTNSVCSPALLMVIFVFSRFLKILTVCDVPKTMLKSFFCI